MNNSSAKLGISGQSSFGKKHNPILFYILYIYCCYQLSVTEWPFAIFLGCAVDLSGWSVVDDTSVGYIRVNGKTVDYSFSWARTYTVVTLNMDGDSCSIADVIHKDDADATQKNEMIAWLNGLTPGTVCNVLFLTLYHCLLCHYIIHYSTSTNITRN